jgi:hypothetical protein
MMSNAFSMLLGMPSSRAMPLPEPAGITAMAVLVCKMPEATSPKRAITANGNNHIKALLRTLCRNFFGVVYMFSVAYLVVKLGFIQQ